MTTQFSQTDTPTLYDRDYLLWVETTVRQLREQDLEHLDWENLIEEIETMGRSEKNALSSNLRILLMHLLKWKYQPSKRSNSWAFSIAERAIRLNKAFKNSPTLQRYFEEVFDECYLDARKLASKETGLAIDTFPVVCPFSQFDVLNSDYLPEN